MFVLHFSKTLISKPATTRQIREPQFHIIGEFSCVAAPPRPASRVQTKPSQAEPSQASQAKPSPTQILNTAPHLAIPVHDISRTCPLLWRFQMPVHHISSTRPLIWRFLFNINLKHAPSFGVFGFETMNTPPPLAIPVQQYIYIYIHIYTYYIDVCIYIYIYIMYTYIYTYIKYSLLWRFRFNTYLTHAPPPPFGDSGSSYILNTAPHLAIPVRHIS